MRFRARRQHQEGVGRDDVDSGVVGEQTQHGVKPAGKVDVVRVEIRDVVAARGAPERVARRRLAPVGLRQGNDLGLVASDRRERVVGGTVVAHEHFVGCGVLRQR